MISKGMTQIFVRIVDPQYIFLGKRQSVSTCFLQTLLFMCVLSPLGCLYICNDTSSGKKSNENQTCFFTCHSLWQPRNSPQRLRSLPG